MFGISEYSFQAGWVTGTLPNCSLITSFYSPTYTIIVDSECFVKTQSLTIFQKQTFSSTLGLLFICLLFY